MAPLQIHRDCHGHETVLVFFHLDSGLNKTAHEWLGWLLVAAVVAHASVNWVSLRRYLLNSRRAQGVLVVSALVLAGIALTAMPASSRPGRSS